MGVNDKLIKICPKCGKLSLEVDFDKGILTCKECGYEVKLQKWGKEQNQKLRE